ncbi:MAG: hypothetical protein ACI81W_004059 [Saprospiraceae bacterium]
MGDVYIYVNPNEDFLVIHNGSQKLNANGHVHFLINKGSSYSAYCILGSLALSKYLQQEYQEKYILGISQGGNAALFNAL